MILYFSGTGNSRHAAEKLAELTGDEAKPLAEGFRAEKPRAVNSKNPLVFVCPVHYGKLPRIVAEFIEKTPFTGKRLQPIRRTKKRARQQCPAFLYVTRNASEPLARRRFIGKIIPPRYARRRAPSPYRG